MRVLLVHPEFPETFWSFGPVLELVGLKALNPPLGLVTVAAMLPQTWEPRLVDCAVRAPTEADWEFADLVLLTGMIVQKPSMMALIDEAAARGKPIAVGGPYATSVPQDFEAAGVDYLVLDEGELSIPPFVEHLNRNGPQRRAPDAPTPRFTAKGQKPDLTETPVPRFDLLDMHAYDAMAIQYSRGCPFLCEFCDIITLYGRRPRTKSSAQMQAELSRLFDLGWRGGIFFVDDNFIGNKPNVKKFLPDLLAWQQAHGFPFWFDTEASIDLAADQELMEMMVRCGFASVFIGIETPDEDSLELTRKNQNTRAPMLDSLASINRVGLRVMCGMIIGFDNERPGAGQRIVDFVERASVPTVLLSMLQVLPNTGLWTRLEREGRLLPEVTGVDQTEMSNFIPTRPVDEIAEEYVEAYGKLYDPEVYLERTWRHFRNLGCDAPPASRSRPSVHRRRSLAERRRDLGQTLRFLRAFGVIVWRQGIRRSTRGLFWRRLFDIARHNPARLVVYLSVCAHVEHFAAYAQRIGQTMRPRIAARRAERAGGSPARAALPVVAGRTVAAQG